jgi:hypothetical protein
VFKPLLTDELMFEMTSASVARTFKFSEATVKRVLSPSCAARFNSARLFVKEGVDSRLLTPFNNCANPPEKSTALSGEPVVVGK